MFLVSKNYDDISTIGSPVLCVEPLIVFGSVAAWAQALFCLPTRKKNFFHDCEIALTAHICYPIRLVFYQLLNSQIAYPGIIEPIHRSFEVCGIRLVSKQERAEEELRRYNLSAWQFCLKIVFKV